MTNVRARHLAGVDLMYERRVCGLKQSDIARLMGVSRSRVAHIEAERQPADEAVRRYRAALEQASE
jgi:predicted transcriptional regulator